ncbi:hypothetical protein COLO4_24872 [Corchorus olitorius]|uniref:Uncharacterized protein n=1 Tax=Corchorus olitorius TaxID=93759 RepID=A0A1R3I620_9ROSI|nr:hypothetical protein COLO4_24872 [Corchorus olitorius]
MEINNTLYLSSSAIASVTAIRNIFRGLVILLQQAAGEKSDFAG